MRRALAWFAVLSVFLVLAYGCSQTGTPRDGRSITGISQDYMGGMGGDSSGHGGMGGGCDSSGHGGMGGGCDSSGMGGCDSSGYHGGHHYHMDNGGMGGDGGMGGGMR